MNTAGIISYGAYIPQNRVTADEIARQWGKDSEAIGRSLGVTQKSVAANDEDAATMAIVSSLRAIKNCENLSGENIKAVFAGSESHPYAVKPTSTIVASAIGASKELFAADLEFACKAGTAAMQIVSALTQSDQIKYGLAIGTDTAQSAPGDILEYTSASGAASFLIGSQNPIAKIIDTFSYASDTLDFWRSKDAKYPEHAGRFSGIPAYMAHIEAATNGLLAKINLIIQDFDHIIFHQPNGAFPRKIAKKFGITPEQLKAGLIVKSLGNCYSASSLLGLASVLDIAQPGQKILLTSYGSGSGSDSFAFEVTDEIKNYKNSHPVAEMLENTSEISYAEYLIMRQKVNSKKCQ